MELRKKNASIQSETAGASGTNVSAVFSKTVFDREPVLTPPCRDETIIAEIQSIYKRVLGLHLDMGVEDLRAWGGREVLSEMSPHGVLCSIAYWDTNSYLLLQISAHPSHLFFSHYE